MTREMIGSHGSYIEKSGGEDRVEVKGQLAEGRVKPRGRGREWRPVG